MTKQEILDQIASLINRPGWKVSNGSTEPRKALVEIADSIGVPIETNASKSRIAQSIVEAWGKNWLPTFESAGETVTKSGLEAILLSVQLATAPTKKVLPSPVPSRDESRCIQLGETYRFGEQATCPPDLQFVNGTKNWFFYTDAREKDAPGLRPQAGIWNPSVVKSKKDSRRIPFVICTTYPQRAGSYETPWHDEILHDEGRAYYYGDNKDPKCKNPDTVRGNRVMLETQKLQHSNTRVEREIAAPVLLLSAHGINGGSFGYRTPVGLAAIWRSDQVTQPIPGSKGSFRNLRFELILIDLTEDDNKIDCRWIHARRDGNISPKEANIFAPKSWARFIENGIAALPELQSRNLKLPFQ